MRKLTKSERLKRAKTEAEAHVRKYGLKEVHNFAYWIAARWGFESDDGTINWLEMFMRQILDNDEAKRIAEESRQGEREYQEWKKRWEAKQGSQTGKIDWSGVEPLFGNRKQQSFYKRWKHEKENATNPKGSDD